MEHVTTADAVRFVESCSEGFVAATVTPQHLVLNRNSLFQVGLQPHNYCLPVLKRETHRQAIVSAVFEEAGALDKLEAFTSFNGPNFYGLPRNTSKIKLIKSQWKVPESLSYATSEIIPMFAGETLEWLPSSRHALKCECGVRVAIRIVGLKAKNQMLEQSLTFMKQLNKRYPDAAKFRRMPLQFTEDLDILFSDSAATGEWAYTPSSGVMPHIDETVEEFHTPHDAEFLNDADLKVVRPSELNKKRPLNTDGSSTKSKRKKKFTGAALLTKTLDRIVNVVESSLATLT
ncbi:unnamed protein product [Camellia sinensis]